MKLIRYTANGHVKTGVVIAGKYYDTSAFGEDYNEAFLILMASNAWKTT